MLRHCLMCLAAMILLNGLREARAGDSDGPQSVELALRAALEPKVKELAEQLRNVRHVTQVARPKTSGPPNQPEAGGLELDRIIISLLKDNAVEVKPIARFAVLVRYQASQVSDPKNRGRTLVGVAVTLSIYDGESMREVGSRLLAEVPGVEVTATVCGLPVDGSRSKTVDDLNGVVMAADAKPTAVVATDGTGRAGVASKFGVSLIVAGSPAKATEENGVLVCTLPKDGEFAVRLTNDADFEAAVSLSLDGIGAFAFAEGGKAAAPTHYLVRPRTTLDVPGWYITPEQADRFQIMALPKAAAKELGRLDPSKLHTISATFRAAYDKTPPPDEPSGTLGADEGYGVGRGTRDKFQTQIVPRNLGIERAVVPLRYQVEFNR